METVKEDIQTKLELVKEEIQTKLELLKEEIQAKPEFKEEVFVPATKSEIDDIILIPTIKKEEQESIDPLNNLTDEKTHLTKLYPDSKSTLVSLVKSCNGQDTKCKEDDFNGGEGNPLEVKDDVRELASGGAETANEVDSEETIEERLVEAKDMDVGEVDCIVSLESGESSVEHLEDLPLDNNCNECGELFMCSESLSEHINNTHAKTPSKFCCKLCGMEFKYKANLRKHEKLHNDVFRFKCKYCHISFKQSLTLKNHYIYVHKSEKPYKCEDCESCFKSMNNLKAHIEVHHNVDGETFPCDFCHMEFKRRCYLKRHIRTHTNPDKKFTCDDCGLKCRSKTDIAKHVLTHIGVVEKRFFCEICGAGFSKQAHVVRHRRTHSVEKSFPCELCDRAYKDQYSLKTHHETVHLGIVFSCEICGFQSDRHSLKKHLKRCENQKKYTCENCHKEYYLKKWFDVHITKCRSIKS